MRRAAKIDDNQKEIVSALRKLGASVQMLHSIGKGCPDILIGYRGKNLLAEIKDGNKFPSDRKLNPEQKDWHAAWKGQVCVLESIEEAICSMQSHHF